MMIQKLDKSVLKQLGLFEGQLRFRDFVHNGGWYNKEGEKLGWGDLSPDDIKTIAAKLPPEESFYILSEGDSFWNFVKEIQDWNGAPVVEKKEGPREEKPGIDYVKEKAFMVIRGGKLHTVRHDWETTSEPYQWCGVLCHPIERSSL